MADAIQVQRRRGTEAQCLAMIPAEAETIVDLTNNRIRIGDGVTPGGIIVPNSYDIQQQALNFAVAAGTGDAITVNLNPAPLSYSQPLTFKFRATATNTGAVTINVNGLGTRNIYKAFAGSIVQLGSGDIISGGIYEVSYDGVQFQIIGLSTGIVSVGQGDLRTSEGSVTWANINYIFSVALVAGRGSFPLISQARASLHPLDSPISADSLTLPGGNYGFYPRSVYFGSPPRNVSLIQTYITSSPPYDMGDGDVGGFLFALVNKSGEIVSTYIADTPPWAYNGPTDIRCTHKCKATGKKFRRIMKNRTIEQFMDGSPVEYELQEITHEIKNSDMGLIPHPFGEVPEGHTVVLLDPMSDKVARLIELQNNGGSEMVTDMISNGYIKLDNSPIKRCCPKNVHVSKFKFKSKK